MAQKSMLQDRLASRQSAGESKNKQTNIPNRQPQPSVQNSNRLPNKVKPLNAVQQNEEAKPKSKKKATYQVQDAEENPSGKLKKLKSKNKSDEFQEPEMTEDEILEQQEIRKARKKERAKKRMAKTTKLITILLILCCVYLVFLIYGAINTDYVYNSNGEVIPQAMDIEGLKSKKEYEGVASLYLGAREIYEDILVLDYRIGAMIEDALLIAPEYEKVLDKINSLVLQINAYEAPPEYVQLVDMLAAWTGTDAAVYCQNMSAAIAQNNSVYAENALQYKNAVYNDFSMITKVMVTQGSLAAGCESLVEDIAKWSPEQFITDKVGYVEGTNP